MSAFICSDEHFNVMAEAFHRLAFTNNPRIIVSGFGAKLLRFSAVYGDAAPGLDYRAITNRFIEAMRRENIKSVDHRYRENNDTDTYVVRPKNLSKYCLGTKEANIALIKLIDCYEYQSCEHDGWKGCPVQVLVSELKTALMRKVIQSETSYNDAEWGL